MEVAGLLDQIISLMAPPLCAACSSPCHERAVLCPACDAWISQAQPVVERGPPGADLAVAAAYFLGPARELVHGLKYGHRLALAAVAARAMLRALPADAKPGGAAVPAPSGRWRSRWRGFDPAEEIAASLAEQAGLPLLPCLRRRGGHRQVGRDRFERRGDPPRVSAVGEVPREAVLVDDVWTTGATIAASAQALREAGCRRIVAVSFARVL